VSTYWFFTINGERLLEAKLQGFFASRTVIADTIEVARENAIRSVVDEFGDVVLKIENEQPCDRATFLSTPSKGAAWYEEEIEGNQH
jgi:hypothetical protein